MKLNLRSYKFGFDLWGLLLFALIMLPNIIWFVFPAPNDILRNGSVTPIIDTIASVFQVIMVAALCAVINKEAPRPMKTGLEAGVIISVALYIIGWVIYYNGFASPVVILDLCIAPCAAFIIFSVARKNIAAALSAIVFMICHLTYGIVNFIA